MSQYSNLPGVNLNVQDGQMLLTQDNTTNSMLIIAPVNAPKHVEVPEGPVLVRTEADLKRNFGSYFYKGELNPIAAEWVVAHRGNIRNIYLLGLKGEEIKDRFVELQDKLYNVVFDMNIEQVVLSGMYADEDIEGIQPDDFGLDSFEDIEGLEAYHTFTGTTPVERLSIESGTPVTLGMKLDGRETVLTIDESKDPVALIEELNIQAKAAKEDFGDPIEVTFELVDGTARVRSTRNIELEGTEILGALALESATSSLEGAANPARLLGGFAERYSTEAQSIIAHISVAPVWSTNTGEVNKKVESLVNRNNDISKHVQVIAGPPIGVSIPDSLRTQWLTGVTQYAVLVNGLPVQVAPTNQPLPQTSQLRYNLSLRQLDQLTGNKYVTFRVKNNRVVVVDGVTTAPDQYVGQDIVRSDFTRLSTLRIVNYVVAEMRDALDAFIGQPNEFPIYNAMNTAIKGVIKDSISNAIIQDATYTIELGDSLDASIVNLVILPQFELRSIELNIGLSTPENFNR